MAENWWKGEIVSQLVLMSKRSCQKVDCLLLQCLIARKCWSSVFAPFKVGWENALLEMEVWAEAFTDIALCLMQSTWRDTN